jgi:xanthine/CO dehydrogenase XdhC/CoxF family maturation factor
MRELRDILAALSDLRARGERAAMATVVRVRGSTYRREGARLLVQADGRTLGSISGGCLEGDVAEVARGVIETGRPRLVSYDLTSDDDAVWGLGLGCNGAIDVFVEPASPGEGGDLLAVLLEPIDHRRRVAIATVITSPAGSPAVGARIFIRETGEARGSVGDRLLDDRIVAAARAQMATGRSTVLPVEQPTGQAEVSIEVVAPPLPLLVCGAGHDALPLVRFAHELGWWVTVADSRPAFATRERFPWADEVVLAEDREVAQKVEIDRHTFVVLMTHNFLHDKNILRSLLGTPARYIGLLGPRARTERLLTELANEGVAIFDGQCSRLYGPVGLDLGAETPEEIAVSILAEILAVQNGRTVAFLRDRGGPIHETAQPPDRAARTRGSVSTTGPNVRACQD